MKSHGHAKNGVLTSEYRTWQSMKTRCLNPRSKSFRYYGGRGIKVCKRWLKFDNFIFDMGKKPTRDHSIERKDNNGNYCKSNCKWATHQQQNSNTSRNRMVTMDGKTQTLSEWARHFKICGKKVYSRLKGGWTIDDALRTPILTHWNRRIRAHSLAE